MTKQLTDIPEYTHFDLFDAMNRSGLWPDDKAIADAVPRQSIATIVAAYEAERNAPDFDLRAFAERHFHFPAPPSSGFVSDTTKPIAEHIRSLWPWLKRDADTPESGSRIALPHPYIVPGGRFNEIYYWDSYFTMLGLAVDGDTALIQAMIDNFAYEIETYGFIPNGNRTYFLSRSQPPFFALMVQLLVDTTGDASLWDRYLPALQREYDFWMQGADDLTPEAPAQARVVRLPDGAVLNRYWDALDTPRTEMYATDLELVENCARPAGEVYRNLRAACESGWDFSSRWLADPADLTTIRTTELLPVDLNVLLYRTEEVLAVAYEAAAQPTAASDYRYRAEQRKAAILVHCWDAEARFFKDYHWPSGTRTDAITVGGLYPLFGGIADAEQARTCAECLDRDLLKAGGVISTTRTTAQQWDAPNGWAPLQWVTIVALRNYGYDALAEEVKRRWVALNTRVYERTGKMLEKYNVVDIDLETGGGEYPVQDGFGWTNGVLLRLLSE